MGTLFSTARKGRSSYLFSICTNLGYTVMFHCQPSVALICRAIRLRAGCNNRHSTHHLKRGRYTNVCYLCTLLFISLALTAVPILGQRWKQCGTTCVFELFDSEEIFSFGVHGIFCAFCCQSCSFLHFCQALEALNINWSRHWQRFVYFKHHKSMKTDFNLTHYCNDVEAIAR